MQIYNEIVSFYEQLINDEYHRYKSWEHCYTYFQNSTNLDDDYASLQLAFYLASWGMYRGSSYLLWKDYKIHKELINYLKVNQSIKVSYDYYEQKDNDNINYIMKKIEEIKRYYSEKIKNVNGKEKEIKPSNTLASKVLLGINASIPAFDRFFITGLKMNNIGGSINNETIKNILLFYRHNKDEFDKSYEYIKNKSGTEYPPMKLIDMYFWEIGRKEEERVSMERKKKT